MSGFVQIQEKLQQFIKKFYVNELIKGLLLFSAMGLLYLIITLVIEHFLWLKPVARTFLFWLFVLVETSLLVRYIFIPILKIAGLKKGITEFEASKSIGKHFPEVNDKLLNMLQLKDVQKNSELIEASIEQKSAELQPIPFKRAINFSSNKKYIKFALIPVVIWLITFMTGNSTIFNNSFSRVVHYNTEYEAPAPFSFKVLNPSLNVIEGSPFTLQIETIGSTIPEDVRIFFLNENYYLENNGLGHFEYTFSNIKESLNFYLQANRVVSKKFQINSIPTPVITKLKMAVDYPLYTGKPNEVIENTGNTIVPQGTQITWQIETHQTENIIFNRTDSEPLEFSENSKDYFTYSTQVFETYNYKIATSNQQLTNHESLNFTIQVVPDEYPKIVVQSDIDSITRGPVQFIGQLSDDYGLFKLQLVYYDKTNPNELKKHLIEISRSSFTDFYYIFPEGAEIVEGVDYEMYFELFDNDAVNGSKRTISRKFSYYNKSEKELKEDLLREQKEAINAISKTLEKSKLSNAEVENFKNSLLKKANIDWNDTKKLQEFLRRQAQYEEMFKKQTNQLKQNLNEQPESEVMEERKEDLQNRIEEVNKLAEKEKMIKELNKLTEKLQKENLLEKLKEMAKKNKQNEKSLERILELTKRFYVEQKANQIAEKLNNLAQKEELLSKKSKKENYSEKQEEINNKFSEIKKEIDELKKQNDDLKRPMKIPDNEDEKNEIDKELNKALDELNKQQTDKARKNQKSAAKKMKQLGASMEQSLNAMEGEEIDENIEDLRKIVENLIEFSLQQEDLLIRLSGSGNSHPEYPNNLKRQQVLKEYFEHIDDSLYVLALRLVKMKNEIQKELSDVHYYIDESLLNFTENRFEQGLSNQQFVITGANNLANSLGDLLENLMNASPNFGKGKGDSKGFSLPDIIKKQGELMDEMKEGIKNGEKGDDGENGEQIKGELYEIYKQQESLRQALKELLGNKKEQGKDGSGDVIKQMEELEKELLEKGFSQEIIQKMQRLNYELLKLEKATLEQGEDKKRTSKTSSGETERRAIDKIKLQQQYFNYDEILNRQSLPLRAIYKKKVQAYFKTTQK